MASGAYTEVGYDEGVREYGVGKFNLMLDKYVYELSLDWSGDMVNDGVGTSYTRLSLPTDAVYSLDELAAEAGDRLTDAERDMIAGSVGVIIFENDQGFVEVSYFDNEAEFESEWDACEEWEAEQQEEEEYEPNARSYEVQPIHKISNKPHEKAAVLLTGVVLPDGAFSDKKALAKALREARVLPAGTSLQAMRVEGEKTIAFPRGGLWHAYIITPED